jgi:ribosomal protein L14
MIFPETFLELMDDSNAKQLQCVQVLNKSKRRPATIGKHLFLISMVFSPTEKLWLIATEMNPDHLTQKTE